MTIEEWSYGETITDFEEAMTLMKAGASLRRSSIGYGWIIAEKDAVGDYPTDGKWHPISAWIKDALTDTGLMKWREDGPGYTYWKEMAAICEEAAKHAIAAVEPEFKIFENDGRLLYAFRRCYPLMPELATYYRNSLKDTYFKLQKARY